jgi:exosome complex component RRP42
VNMLSNSEEKYISNGISKNCRIDGRQVFDFRDIHLELGVLPRANGSCKSVLGSTTCIIQIVGDVVTEMDNNIAFIVDKKSDVTEEQVADLESVLSNVKVQLPPINEKFNWQLTATISFTNSSGNIVDACFLALKSAIWDTKLPRVTVLNGEVEVVDDVNAVERLPNYKEFPVSCSVINVGSAFCVDPREEELVAGGVLVHVITGGQISKVVTTNSGLCPSLLLRNIIKSGQDHGIALYKYLNTTLEMHYKSEHDQRISHKINF